MSSDRKADGEKRQIGDQEERPKGSHLDYKVTSSMTLSTNSSYPHP